MSKLLSADFLPGNFGFPFIGEAIEILNSEQQYFLDRFDRYGPAFKTKILGRKYAIFAGPQANQEILKDQHHKVSSRLGWSFLEPILGNGILLQDGLEHQSIRRLLYPALHGNALSDYFEKIHDHFKSVLESWAMRSPISLYREIKILTLSISCQLFLGADNPDQIEELSQWFLELVAGTQALVRLDLPWTRFGRACQSRRCLIEYLRNTIHHRASKKGGSGILGQLLSEGELSEEMIITQTLQLLFAGHDTTSIFLCWLVYELSKRQEWLERLRLEYKKVVGSASLSFSHLTQLTEMGWVLKEIERLYPPAYVIPRGVVEDLEVLGYLIPKGWSVIVSPLLTHRLPELYPEPNQFMPERFSQDKHPFALIGFGAGAHSCLGFDLAQMEIRLFLCLLLRYQWIVTPLKQTSPLRPPKLSLSLRHEPA